VTAEPKIKAITNRKFEVTNTRKLFLAILSLAIFQNANAQNSINANPAEMSDFRAGFVNPAIISFQDAHVALGGKLFHLGFVENHSSPFRQGVASLALPFGVSNMMGLGIQAQYFNSPLYSQSNLGFAITRRVHGIFAIGAKINVFNHAYNEDSFDLVDANDPVFANGSSKWSASVGLGVAAMPYPFLTLGIGIDHINRPNISLAGDEVYQPFKANFGAVLTLGMVQTSISAAYEDNELLPKISIGTFPGQLGLVRLGLNENAIAAEAQLRITGPLSLNYSYDYTLFDNEGIGFGSHQLTLIHEFDRQGNLPKIKMPGEFAAPFVAPDLGLLEQSRFAVDPSSNKLEIIDKTITRHIDPNINEEALAQLTLYDLGILDSSRAEAIVTFEKDTVDMDIVPAIVDANFSGAYIDFIRSLNEKGIRAQIITPKESRLRAAGIKKYFGSDSTLAFVEPVYFSKADSALANQKLTAESIKTQEALTVLSPSITTFSIMPVSLESYAQNWRLKIESEDGDEIRTFAGNGMPPAEIKWDWRGDSGQVIAPGIYYYALQWLDSSGKNHTTDRSPISAQRIIRNITIEITHQPKAIGDDVNEIDLILKK
jgi:hypothetical protein